MDDKGNIVIYQTEDGNTKIDVRFEDETVWLTLDQLSSLFQRDKSTLSRHIKNDFNEGELERDSVVAKIATTAADGKTYQFDYRHSNNLGNVVMAKLFQASRTNIVEHNI